MTQSNRTQHGESLSDAGEIKVVLRGPGDLAQALDFLLGYRPTDSVVLLALHGEQGRFGGRLRVGLPEDQHDPTQWPDLARQLADCLITGSVRRGSRPTAIVAFLCQDPRAGERPSEVMRRLRPLAQQLRIACGEMDVPVIEALCVSGGRWWSYCRPDGAAGAPEEGVPVAEPAGSAIAATAAYSGIPMPVPLRDLESRLRPIEPPVLEHETALDLACGRLVPRMLDRNSGAWVADHTVELAGRALDAFLAAPPVNDRVRSDRRDDALLDDKDAAELILGFQDHAARDRVVEWADPLRAGAALRLWRALARRCAGPYAEHAAAPLALVGWVAWCLGDDAEARVALSTALDLEPHCTFARLLQHAVSQGLDPDVVRRSLRSSRRRRVLEASTVRRGPDGGAGRGPGRRSPGGRRARIRR
ncbi:DUF4192 domain-containing protein [Actinacidiphila bryophytorum]|uniref:DUF4192 domain-containing protein n=1 Tax=Actinacidiphila bryophytorum TaxID=1436133 RepID=UPI0021769FA7|nr:DUF4192 domain-containing protein [Actinacidiphila bryophytorum]UWE11785.1 DUF4192 domain-containing protein [Actinacidiphila bryophytorum]